MIVVTSLVNFLEARLQPVRIADDPRTFRSLIASAFGSTDLAQPKEVASAIS